MVEPIEVGVGKYERTENPDEYLITEGLDSCIGLGLVGLKNGIQKRGLAHIFYDGNLKDGGLAKLSEEDALRIKSDVDGILKDWNGYENIKSFIIANRFEKAKVSENDVPKHTNPGFNYVTDLIKEKFIDLKLYEDIEWKDESLPESLGGNKLVHIHWKDVVLHKDKINIMYKDDSDKWLNSKNFSHPLD